MPLRLPSPGFSRLPAARFARVSLGALFFLAPERLREPAGIETPPNGVVAIVGATLIDGNGGTPVADAVVVVTGDKITEVGPRSRVKVPAGARVIDAAGKFMTPGFIDTNVHLSLYNISQTMLRFEDKLADIVIEAAQINLKHGITTARDSYGMPKPGIIARDLINSGKVIGPRLYIAGNIVAWGGTGSFTFSGAGRGGAAPTFWDERMQDMITEGAGEELMLLEPDSVRVRIGQYLDLGVDFVKYGASTHAFYPALITLSQRAQTALVAEVHRRGKVAETHATSPESLRMALLAGIDLIQHPERLDAPMSDELVKLIVDRKAVCSMLEAGYTGKAWENQQKTRATADSAAKTRADSLAALPAILKRKPTGAELRQEESGRRMRYGRENAIKLIKAGCIVSTSTDQLNPGAPEFDRGPRAIVEGGGTNELAFATLNAIEGLVELGMTPLQAITAATKNGAIASHDLALYGTIEKGKFADILLLDADPSADIHNIRKLSFVMRSGDVIDIEKLPTNPILSGRPVLIRDSRP